MRTEFAPAKRLSKDLIDQQVNEIKNNVFLINIMSTLKSLIAVINMERQIVAVNKELIKTLGFNSMDEVFGLRLGEAIHCVYTHTAEGGCGTTKMCKSCGAIRAILNSIEKDSTQVELCAIRTNKDNHIKDIALEVTATPITLRDQKFITLFMRDTSKERLQSVLERSFFHDINNLLTALVGSSEILTLQEKRDLTLESKIYKLSTRIAKEIEVQRAISYAQGGSYEPDIKEFEIQQLVNEINTYAITNRILISIKNTFSPGDKIKSDQTLILRILTNMIKNGWEATSDDEAVVIRLDKDKSKTIFSVWNNQTIPEEINNRIFQEHFSTKKGTYRGLGTHSMKVFGEKILEGKVWFESEKNKGTTFFFELPEK